MADTGTDAGTDEAGAARRRRRRELGSFLRSRRERIDPAALGLPLSGGARRTPGLRREEVAQLADVGVTWYTWLEQGRDITASEQVLAALARTLGLSDYEAQHLLHLARPHPSLPVGPDAEDHPVARAGEVTEPVLAVLDELEPAPAVAHSPRADILACNAGYEWLMDVSSVPPERRNSMLLTATDPAWQARMPDWTERLPTAVAELRAQMASRLDDPAWPALVDALCRESPRFAALWEKHDVAPMADRAKRFAHPEAGLLRFGYTHLWSDGDVRVTVYTAADRQTRRALERFVPAAS